LGSPSKINHLEAILSGFFLPVYIVTAPITAIFYPFCSASRDLKPLLQRFLTKQIAASLHIT
jgi:hypothetical protein